MPHRATRRSVRQHTDLSHLIRKANGTQNISRADHNSELLFSRWTDSNDAVNRVPETPQQTWYPSGTTGLMMRCVSEREPGGWKINCVPPLNAVRHRFFGFSNNSLKHSIPNSTLLSSHNNNARTRVPQHSCTECGTRNQRTNHSAGRRRHRFDDTRQSRRHLPLHRPQLDGYLSVRRPQSHHRRMHSHPFGVRARTEYWW